MWMSSGLRINHLERERHSQGTVKDFHGYEHILVINVVQFLTIPKLLALSFVSRDTKGSHQSPFCRRFASDEHHCVCFFNGLKLVEEEYRKFVVLDSEKQ